MSLKKVLMSGSGNKKYSMKDRKDIPCLQTNLLERWANLIRGFYGHPVYLGGSQLVKDAPRDVDVFVIIPDDEFKLRYQCDDIKQWGLRYNNGLWDDSNWNWADDISHKSLQAMKFIRMQIDFKLYPQSYQDEFYKDKELLQLDTYRQPI